MVTHDQFIQRCFDLAKLGAGGASPNPMVGAVLVYNNRIIGEGYHKIFGQDHAEVHCLKSVKKDDRYLIKQSTLYISLEPCCIIGNTPACTDLIKKHEIKKVIYATIDPTSGVNGKSKEKLESNGIQVVSNIFTTKGNQIIRPRNAWAVHKKPYVILKYARSKDGFIGRQNQQVWLSNSYTKILSHKWRSEVDAILIGTNTAALDNPQLNTRLYPGRSPLRVVLDREKRLDRRLFIFDNSTPTWVITELDLTIDNRTNIHHQKMSFDHQLLYNLLAKLYQANKGILLVEGGSQLINSFIKTDLWDEARIFQTDVELNTGVEAPIINAPCHANLPIKNNNLLYFLNPSKKASVST